jgi:uncharacterized membrane protein
MTITQRQMTKKERAYLQREQILRPTLRAMLAISLFLTFVLTMIGSGIWSVIARVSGLMPRRTDWSEVPVVFWGVVMISLLATVYCFGVMLWSHQRDNTRTKSRQEGIAADTAAGIVSEERVEVVGVACFREEEHYGKIYFLLFADKRVLVRYDYNSVNMDGGNTSKRSNFPIHRDLAMIRFPQSGLVKFDWSGPKIRKPRTISLTLHPKFWPDDETYCTIPWDDLASVLSQPR